MGAELAGMIVRKDEARRIVKGPVLVPGEPDSDGDVVTPEKIEQVAHRWMELYQNNDLMHSLINVAVPVESYVTDVELEFELPSKPGEKVLIPKGTWMMGSRVKDDSTWSQVQKGELSGFSIMAVSAAALKSANRQAALASVKRITLADLGPDWEVVAVSLVDEPAVPKAKWVAVKSREPGAADRDGLWERLAKALGMRSDKGGRSISDATLAQLNRARDAQKETLSVLEELIRLAEAERTDKSTKEALDMNPDELKTMIQDSVKAAIQPLTDAIGQLVAALQGTGNGGGAGTGDGTGGDAGKDAGKAADKPGSGSDGGTAGKAKDPGKGTDPEKEALKAKIQELEGALAKSRTLRGQDTDTEGATKTAQSDRDPWGRKRRAAQ